MSAREEGRKRKSAREDGRGRKRRRSTKQERRRRRGEERLSGMMKNKAEVCGGSYRTMRSWEFAIPLEVCGDSDGLMGVCGARGDSYGWLENVGMIARYGRHGKEVIPEEGMFFIFNEGGWPTLSSSETRDRSILYRMR